MRFQQCCENDTEYDAPSLFNIEGDVQASVGAADEREEGEAEGGARHGRVSTGAGADDRGGTATANSSPLNSDPR